MKENKKEIAKKLTPQTSIDEIASYCDTVEDFDELFREYLTLQGEAFEGDISELIKAEYQRQNEEINFMRSVMEKHKKNNDKIS